MAYAIMVFFDAHTERIVRDVWNRIAEENISSYLAHGPAHPHMTLAICESLNVPAFSAVLEWFAQDQACLAFTLSRLGTFSGSEHVVYVSPTKTHGLLTLHQDVHRLLEDRGSEFVEYYLHDQWEPHCTLAYGLPEQQVAPTLALCYTLLPDVLIGTITQIGLIDTQARIEICKFDFQRIAS